MAKITAVVNIVRGTDSDALRILNELKANPDVLATEFLVLELGGIPDTPPEWIATHTVTQGVPASLRDDATGQTILKAVDAGTPVKILDTKAYTIGGWTNRAKVELEDGTTGNLWWPRLEQIAIGGGDNEDAALGWPTEHRVVTQKFGEHPEYYLPYGLDGHEGLDIRAPKGSKIFSSLDGKVIQQANTAGAYGNYVRIQGDVAGGHLVTVYAHFEQALVKQGDMVKRGQVIGLADATGNVRPPNAHHLHYGGYWVDDNGKRLNENNGYKGYVDLSPLLGL